MKKIIILILIFVIIILYFVLNYFVNLKASTKIEKAISIFIDNNFKNNVLKWEDISYKYIGKTVIINNLSFKFTHFLLNNIQGDYFEVDIEKIILQLNDINQLKNYSDINDIKITCIDLDITHFIKQNYSNNLNEIKYTIKKIDFELRGHLDADFFDDPMYSLLPDEKLKFSLNFKQISNNFKDLVINNSFSINDKSFIEMLKIDKLSLNIIYHPQENKISSSILISNSKISIESDNEIIYNADRLINFELKKLISINEITAKNVMYNNELFSIKTNKFKVKTKLNLIFDKYQKLKIIPYSDIDLSANEILFNISNDSDIFWNYPDNQIMLDKINLVAEFNNEAIQIKNSYVKSDLFIADIAADLKYIKDFPEESLIEHAQIRFSDLDNNLFSVIEQFEEYNDILFERTDHGFILNFYGTLQDIRLKGFPSY